MPGRRLGRLDPADPAHAELVMAWLSGAVVAGKAAPAPRTPREQVVELLRGAIDDLMAVGDEDAAVAALEVVMKLDGPVTAPDGGGR